ncbi:hypothetical protein LTSERUB_3213 [Salmonella enterica subsp. enterica serovar Rubislaw str. A4-653]|uniref:Uncharacterized protein n=1 Tax=Salmonella enterica subsp. enterica serovar Rubislaw str. A4-653 TaxID=913081 RepID=G5QKK0_SALRU|nr:hypothetical protein LTSERUB_3213 [Salmonella enterica subsp. enterica serovar Rubislaw str. A4-653]
MHTQTIPSCDRVFFHQTVIGMTKLAPERFIMRRTKPGWIFTFGFGGVLSATAACTFLLWCNQKRGHIPLDRHFARNESGLRPSTDSSVEDYCCYPHPPTLMAVFGYCFMKCMRYNLSQARACFVTP